MNDKPGEDLDGSGSGLLLLLIIIIIIIIIMSGWNKIMSGVAHVLDICVKCPLFLCCFNQNWDESRNFSGCLQYQTT
jgi:hypothetical protein